MDQRSDQDVFSLYPNLPPDVQKTILNNLPFIDLFNFCLSGKVPLEVCSSDQYFQQRLLSRGFDQSQVLSYQALIRAGLNPSDSYIITLIKAKSIRLDPTVLIYLSDSSILFPGLEYFIGLGKMGQRAIDNDRADYLLYVLRLYPSKNELRHILGTLYVKYMNNKHGYKSDGSLFTNINQQLLDQLLWLNQEIQSLEHAVDVYYPKIEPAYLSYQAGLHGLPNPESNMEMSYLYGLIDGHHDQMFEDFIRSKELPIRPFMYSVREYVAKRGTVRMVETIADYYQQAIPVTMMEFMGVMGVMGVSAPKHPPEKFGPMIVDAIEGDNLSAVDFFLTTAMEEVRVQERTQSSLGIIPRSKQMLDLLRSKGMRISDQAIFVGALWSSNYRLLLSTFGENWYDNISFIELDMDEIDPFFHAIAEGSAYLTSAYFTKFRGDYEWSGQEVEPGGLTELMTGFLVPGSHLYKEELMLSLGYKPSDHVKELIINSVDKNLMRPILDLNLANYPNLQKIMS